MFIKEKIVMTIFVALAFLLVACGKVSKHTNENENVIEKSINYAGDGLYPIIFVHGHGTDLEIEDTWTDMIKKLDGSEGYTMYPETVYEETKLPSNLSAQKLFRFSYYRANKNAPFGDVPGYIGKCPKKFTKKVDYTPDGFIEDISPNGYYNWQNKPRVSYVDRLGKLVDEVMKATGAKRVILVGHSMGGLVSRAYVYWGGGQLKVAKILTVGTPNKGVPEGLGKTVEKYFNAPGWQENAECEELSKRRDFEGKSYTEWLNDGWEAFCKRNGIQYAAIRGSFDPWNIPVHIGDGVVEEADAVLDGAVFNGVVYAAHVDKINEVLPFGGGFGTSGGDFLNTTAIKEFDLRKTTYVSQVIKQWIMQNKSSQRGAAGEALVYPDIFNDEAQIGFRSTGNIYAQVEVVDMMQHTVAYFGFPLTTIPYQKLDLKNLGFLPNGAYILLTRIYDMEKLVSVQKIKVGKSSTRNTKNPILETIEFIKKPEKFCNTIPLVFQMADLDYSGPLQKYFMYKLDEGNWSVKSSSDSITFFNMMPGDHTLYVKGERETGEYNGDGTPVKKIFQVIEYHWVQASPKAMFVENELVSGEKQFQADQSVVFKNVTLSPGAKVTVKAKSIDLRGIVDIKQGSYVDIKCN